MLLVVVGQLSDHSNYVFARVKNYKIQNTDSAYQIYNTILLQYCNIFYCICLKLVVLHKSTDVNAHPVP